MMRKLFYFALKVARKIYCGIFGKYQLPELIRETDPNKSSDMIYELLSGDKPCMIARYGSTEMLSIVNYLGVKDKTDGVWCYIQGKGEGCWWNPIILNQMQQWSGFFPPTAEKVSQFAELMIEDSKEVDILGSWIKNEYYLREYLSKVSKVSLLHLDPFWSKQPWTRVLAGKKVLVVHPFAETIISQYSKRELLFDKKDTLPEFKSLQVIKAVQSIGGDDNGFSDWFDALEYMKSEIDKCDYDVCLIGCGAYGFPLAAHVKRSGKKAVHLAGALQLLFGIRGKRWEDPDYGMGHKKYIPHLSYPNLINDSWVTANNNEKPVAAQNVEGGCYW